MRTAAASSNAAIAKQVAEKRAKIARGKGQAQEVVRNIQADLALAKEEYRLLRTQEKSQRQAKSIARKKSSDSLDLLQKLKEAHELGLLTEEEYTEKRKKLVSQI